MFSACLCPYFWNTQEKSVLFLRSFPGLLKSLINKQNGEFLLQILSLGGIRLSNYTYSWFLPVNGRTEFLGHGLPLLFNKGYRLFPRFKIE